MDEESPHLVVEPIDGSRRDGIRDVNGNQSGGAIEPKKTIRDERKQHDQNHLNPNRGRHPNEHPYRCPQRNGMGGVIKHQNRPQQCARAAPPVNVPFLLHRQVINIGRTIPSGHKAARLYAAMISRQTLI